MPVQLRMSFLETPPPASADQVWATLDDEQRVEVVATLARQIAKVAAGANEETVDDSKEKTDE